MLSIHRSQVTFFDKVDAAKVQEELVKYQPWINTSTMSLITGKEGKVTEVFVDKGNVWFEVAVEDGGKIK